MGYAQEGKASSTQEVLRIFGSGLKVSQPSPDNVTWSGSFPPLTNRSPDWPSLSSRWSMGRWLSPKYAQYWNMLRAENTHA